MRPTTRPRSRHSAPTRCTRSLVVRRALLLEPPVTETRPGRALAPAEVELVAAAAERGARLGTPSRLGRSSARRRAGPLAEDPATPALRRRRSGSAADPVVPGRVDVRRASGSRSGPGRRQGRAPSPSAVGTGTPGRRSGAPAGSGARGGDAVRATWSRSCDLAGRVAEHVGAPDPLVHPAEAGELLGAQPVTVTRAAQGGIPVPSVSTATSARPRW